MPTCISNVAGSNATVTALSSPADGYSYSVDTQNNDFWNVDFEVTCSNQSVQVTCVNILNVDVYIDIDGLNQAVVNNSSYNNTFTNLTIGNTISIYTIDSFTYSSGDVSGLVQITGGTPTPSPSGGSGTATPTPSPSAGTPSPTPTSTVEPPLPTLNAYLYNWGSNINGEIGNNSTINVISAIQTTAGTNNWRYVSDTIDGSTYAIKNDNTLWTWGNNSTGQLGIGTTINV